MSSRRATAIAEGLIYYALYCILSWLVEEWGLSKWNVYYPGWMENGACLIYLTTLFCGKERRAAASLATTLILFFSQEQHLGILIYSPLFVLISDLMDD